MVELRSDGSKLSAAELKTAVVHVDELTIRTHRYTVPEPHTQVTAYLHRLDGPESIGMQLQDAQTTKLEGDQFVLRGWQRNTKRERVRQAWWCTVVRDSAAENISQPG